MEVQRVVVFNGVTYRLMGAGTYYLSQSTSNEGRRSCKGLHVAVWEFHSRQRVPKGRCIHHKDGNHFNNDFSNLECLSYREHRALHPYSPQGLEKQKKHLESIRSKAAEWHRSEEGREWHRQHGIRCAEKRKNIRFNIGCHVCGATFESKRKWSKYCSRRCGSTAYANRKNGL